MLQNLQLKKTALGDLNLPMPVAHEIAMDQYVQSSSGCRNRRVVQYLIAVYLIYQYTFKSTRKRETRLKIQIQGDPASRRDQDSRPELCRCIQDLPAKSFFVDLTDKQFFVIVALPALVPFQVDVTVSVDIFDHYLFKSVLNF
jgi:hypothetical protein